MGLQLKHKYLLQNKAGPQRGQGREVNFVYIKNGFDIERLHCTFANEKIDIFHVGD